MFWGFKILKRIRAPGVGLPLSRGIIHVHNHNFQRTFSLQPLGQSTPNFIGSIHPYEGGTSVIINKPDHMIKMAALSI